MPTHVEELHRTAEDKVVSCGIASNAEEIEAAFRLVHNTHLRCGYISAQPHGIKVNVHSALPGTTVFVAKVRGTVVSTLSLIADSPLGLPMEAFYADEVAELRARGGRLGEVSALADRRAEMHRCLNELLALSRMLFCYARSNMGLSDLCIAVNPRHEAYYTGFLKFEHLGRSKTHAAVQGATPVALRLNIESLERRALTDERMWRLLNDKEAQGVSLEKKYHFTDEDARYFLVEKSNALAEASPEAQAYLQSIYPSLVLEQGHVPRSTA